MGRKPSEKPKRITSFYLSDVSKLIIEYLRNKWEYSSDSKVVEHALNIALAQNFKDLRNTPDNVLDDQREKLEQTINKALNTLHKLQDHQENSVLLEQIKLELKRVTIKPERQIHYAKCKNCDFKKKLKDPDRSLAGARCPQCNGILVREVKEVSIPIE